MSNEIRGEQALDAFADLLEPLFTILNDGDVRTAYRAGNNMKAIQLDIKNHKKEVITCLAILDGEDPETYKPGIFTLPVKIIKLLNNPEFSDLFTLQGQKMPSGSSGSAMADTQAGEN